jgi:glycine dehydrogenase
MEALSESELLTEMDELANKNEVFRSYLGIGYHNVNLPTVIKRCVLENPGWYTQYTPYQAEISQGRMETLFNFQSMICELTGLEIANASLLDEPTAAGEAMSMCYMVSRKKKKRFYVSSDCNPNTIDLVVSRGLPLGIEVEVCDLSTTEFEEGKTCGVLFQYPNTHGGVEAHDETVARAKAAGAMTVAATDLLALTVLRPPGEFGVDIAVGSAQRFGVPLGYGGPHAAFISCAGIHMRKMPGRIIGKTIDSHGDECYRLALQTREQHIRRGKAVSNICTAQALLANMAALYGQYHGPDGLRDIANRVHSYAVSLADAVTANSAHTVVSDTFFDTVAFKLSGTTADAVVAAAAERRINLRKLTDDTVVVALDETVAEADLHELIELFTGGVVEVDGSAAAPNQFTGTLHGRTSEFMTHDNFNLYHSETEMMRYIKRLENKDLSLCHDMIPLGSCTMKLNSAVEMQAVTMPGFCNIHPFAPHDQAKGYHQMFDDIKDILCEVTGYDGMSLQPNSGAQGELAGLMAIRGYHNANGDHHRNICFVPVSAHGTNPASASMAGMTNVDINVRADGTIDLDDVKLKLEKHSANLAVCHALVPL